MHVCTYRIDLEPGTEDIWKKFRGNVRTAVRKAEKNAVDVVSGTSEDDLKMFYSVYSDPSNRDCPPETPALRVDGSSPLPFHRQPTATGQSSHTGSRLVHTATAKSNKA